jgi:hypothetical protein
VDVPQKFTWEDGALALLDSRDRFTRKEIREEFRSADLSDKKKTFEFDPDEHGYLTQVSNGRFSVVWYQDPGSERGVVRAVLPLPGIDGPRQGLKEHVERAIDEALRRAMSAS